jgi:hypothetical protein
MYSIIFDEPSAFYLQGRRVSRNQRPSKGLSCTRRCQGGKMKIEAVGSSETLEPTYQNTYCYETDSSNTITLQNEILMYKIKQ